MLSNAINSGDIKSGQATIADDAWLCWIRTFQAGADVEDLRDLGDVDLLILILQEMDSDAFRYLGECKSEDQSPSRSDNWVLRHNDFKRLYKSLNEFLTSYKAACHVHVLPTPDLRLVAKYQDIKEIQKLLNFVLCAAFTSKDRTLHLSRIATLPESFRKILLDVHIPLADDIQNQGDISGSSAIDHGQDTGDSGRFVNQQAEKLAYSPHERLYEDLQGDIRQSSEVKQLRRQYSELHNQLLMTENQLATKTTESIEKEAALQVLRRQIAAGQKIAALKESSCNHEQCLEQVSRLTTINGNYQSKLKQIQSHASVLEERIHHLESMNEILHENTRLKVTRQARHSSNPGEDADMILQADVSGSPVPDRSALHDLGRVSTVPKTGSTSQSRTPQVRIKDDSKEIKYNSTPSQSGMAEDELNLRYESMSNNPVMNQNDLQKQDTAQHWGIHHASQHSTINKMSGSDYDKRRYQHENAIIMRAFYDLAARLQHSSLTLQRATASPQSFLSSRRLALGILAPVSRSRSST